MSRSHTKTTRQLRQERRVRNGPQHAVFASDGTSVATQLAALDARVRRNEAAITGETPAPRAELATSRVAKHREGSDEDGKTADRQVVPLHTRALRFAEHVDRFADLLHDIAEGLRRFGGHGRAVQHTGTAS